MVNHTRLQKLKTDTRIFRTRKREESVVALRQYVTAFIYSAENTRRKASVIRKWLLKCLG